jgi:hypothetical protein
MRNIVIISIVGALALGCGKDKDKDSKGSKSAAKPAAGATDKSANAADRYKEINNLVAKAKTSDDFIDIVMKCGGIEIELRGKAAGDPAHQKACTIAPAQARAKLAIAESNPDNMSTHCITAAMNLEELIEAKVQVDEHKKLLDQVNKACGM